MTPENDEADAIAAHRPRDANVPDETQRKRNGSSCPDQEGDDEIAVEGFKPLLPEGKWFEARFDGHSTAIIFAAQKVFWEFTITEAGEWFEQKLFRAFRVRKVIACPSKNGKFVLAAGGEMYQTIVRLLDVKQRTDRIPMRPLRARCYSGSEREPCEPTTSRNRLPSTRATPSSMRSSAGSERIANRLHAQRSSKQYQYL